MSQEVSILKLEAETIFKEKNMVLSYIFLILFGGFGIHRFYLEDSKIGALILLTCMITLTGVIPYLNIILSLFLLSEFYFVYKLTNEFNERIQRTRFDYVNKRMEENNTNQIKAS